ncbi:hypothetical protein PBY51_005674 [Eleginops maclovinus]|uniref:L27 domain-containing protein n=1 Tax=Eleginops maclovinus TaxID=56733 RepID=A0AAN8AAG7_ELEMC|nr:hypothetical protein PBY51_005674 [Eleginops maclovinus]
MPLKRKDTQRALQVMEACQASVADGVKGRAEKLLNVFQSDLFQALLDIQEFYELTVCENQTMTSRPHTPAQVQPPPPPPSLQSTGQHPSLLPSNSCCSVTGATAA